MFHRVVMPIQSHNSHLVRPFVLVPESHRCILTSFEFGSSQTNPVSCVIDHRLWGLGVSYRSCISYVQGFGSRGRNGLSSESARIFLAATSRSSVRSIPHPLLQLMSIRCAHQEYTEGSYLLARGRKGERRLSEGSGDFRGLSGQCRGL